MKVALVVGARPNFMKAAPIVRAAPEAGLEVVLVHTGQHYDEAMSDRFFEELDLPRADVHLGVGSANHAVQTAKIMGAFDAYCEDDAPDAVAVVGDVNSTVAAALVAAKRVIPVAHVEAGLRSFDRSMPEEINRLITDALSDWLLTPSEDADANLRAEGVAPERIFFVGNVMIDTLLHCLDRARERRTAERLGVQAPYGVVTLHRPGNVDDPRVLGELVETLRDISGDLPLVFPVHPRTRKRLAEFGLAEPLGPRVILTEPLGYLDTMSLVEKAAVVLTDSGGLQEETTVLGVPCLTLRPSTERPVTVTHGTNRVVGNHREAILSGWAAVRGGSFEPRRPPLWDGHAGQRMAQVLAGVAPPLAAARSPALRS